MAKHSSKAVINNIRSLALDMIHEAKSGHPGIALGAAPILYTLFTHHLRLDISRKDYPNRDRFVMSAGHGSALLYSTLFYAFEDYTLDDLKKFRTIYSNTPGHPELDIDHRIEVTTGPLGQGLSNAVGMAMAERHLEDNFNSKKNVLFDYDIYALVSDGDMMEGISYESASLAAKFNLDNLIVLWDSNLVSLDGELEDGLSDDISNVYADLGWKVFYVKKGDSVSEINKAINAAKKANAPSLIVVNTIIGKYSKYEGTNKIHGNLELEDYVEIKKQLKFEEEFMVDNVNLVLYRQYIRDRLEGEYQDWYVDYERYIASAGEEEANRINAIVNNESVSLQLDKVIDTSKLFTDRSLRDINYQIMNVIATFVPNFIGGASDVVGSTKTYLKGKNDFSSDDYKGRNISFGVREHAMGGIANGLALSNMRPFVSCFLAFSDYLKPAIRMSAMMNLPVTYIFTHDSIMVGQDGKTHEPVEQLAALRTIPNFNVYRPADYKELIGSWNEILSKASPCALILPRGHVETQEFTNSKGVPYGAYIISEVKKSLDLILMTSGSEVTLAMKLKEELMKNYIETRVVSVPSIKNFLSQDKEYINEVLPKGYKKIALEFSNDPNWYKLLNSNDSFIGVEEFGESGIANDILKANELDIANLVIKIKSLI